MKFEKIFLNIISEAVQSSTLQNLINAVKAQYNQESDKARVSILKKLCKKISAIASEMLNFKDDKQLSKKDKIVLFALKDFSDNLYEAAEEKAKLIDEKLNEREAFDAIIIPAVEEEYEVKVSPEVKNNILNQLDADNRYDYHMRSKAFKRALDYFFKRIDAANVTDDDIIEAPHLSDFSRKAKGDFSIIACFNNSNLEAIIYFNDDGTLNFIDSFNYGYRGLNRSLNMTKLNSVCNKFIAVKKSKDAINKIIQRRANAEYSKTKSYDEQRIENMRRYQQIKQDKINKERVKNQQTRIIKTLADAKEAIKTYDPEFDTFEAIEIIRTYKDLKYYLNSSVESGYANEYINTIEENIKKLKENAGVAE